MAPLSEVLLLDFTQLLGLHFQLPTTWWHKQSLCSGAVWVGNTGNTVGTVYHGASGVRGLSWKTQGPNPLQQTRRPGPWVCAPVGVWLTEGACAMGKAAAGFSESDASENSEKLRLAEEGWRVLQRC